MRVERAGFEFRMELGAEEEGWTLSGSSAISINLPLGDWQEKTIPFSSNCFMKSGLTS